MQAVNKWAVLAVLAACSTPQTQGAGADATDSGDAVGADLVFVNKSDTLAVDAAGVSDASDDAGTDAVAASDGDDAA